jgi:tRNA modification GTPase
MARPGEFTERAFLNGKLDLAQAEAIADLIEAGSGDAARAALRSLQGEFSRRVHAIVESLVRLRTHVEATLDFPEEEIDYLADARLQDGLDRLANAVDDLFAGAKQGVLLHDGMTVVIAGPPNAGKSSLLNALARTDAAIVSPVPGTTRDVLKERIHIDGMPLHVVDTAGLRESADAIEAEGVRRAREQLVRADLVLYVIDDAHPEAQAATGLVPDDLPRTKIRNKIDLTHREAGRVETASGTEIALSVATGAGLDVLRDYLKERMGYQSEAAGTFSARRRHLDALSRARAALVRGQQNLRQARAGELVAEELRHAQSALGEITGEFTSEDLLGKIFAEFCIGK